MNPSSACHEIHTGTLDTWVGIVRQNFTSSSSLGTYKKSFANMYGFDILMYFCCMQKTNLMQICLLFQIYHTLYNNNVKPVIRVPVHLPFVLIITMHYVNK